MDTATAADQGPGKSKARSPNYPAFHLEEAIQKARILHEKEGNAAVPVSVACTHWGLSATSSTGLRAIATMQAFGLVDVEGAGDAKRLRLSQAGRTLVRHPDQTSREYLDALKAAALGPKIHREVWEKYGKKELPSDGTLGWDLENEWKFLHTSIGQVVEEIRATFSFAKVGSESHTPSTGGGKPPPPVNPNPRGQEQNPMQLAFDPGASVRDLPLPLISGGTAILRLPSAITEEDFQWLRTMLERLKPSILGQRPELPKEPPEAPKQP